MSQQRSDESQYDISIMHLNLAAQSIAGAAANLADFVGAFALVPDGYEPTDEQVNTYEYVVWMMGRSLTALEEVERCLDQQLQERAATSTEPSPPPSTASGSTPS